MKVRIKTNKGWETLQMPSINKVCLNTEDGEFTIAEQMVDDTLRTTLSSTAGPLRIRALAKDAIQLRAES